MSLQEKSINCFDCGVTFTFTMEEQLAYQAKGHFNVPKRCPSCRQARKDRQMKSSNLKSPQPGFKSERQMFPATCAQCGKNTQVPFEPKDGRPVYCRECYYAIKASR
ncbi:MAG: zinc-ribbon domain containing protein [Dehalococcoidales bacterium]|nr:zinc-ribbon domain containing protein [Dehalococcoidales bacterium]